MIPLLLLALLLTGASAVPTELLENFECGPESSLISGVAKWAAQTAIADCHSAVQDRTNLCCKEHDLCFDLHSKTGNTQTVCDSRFCLCLQDVIDRTKETGCEAQLHTFCDVARRNGEKAYRNAHPDKHIGLFDGFEDKRPLDLDMKKLVDTCEYSKVIAVHCHNSVHTCMRSDHVMRIGRATDEEQIYFPHQDCHSNMYFCLRLIVENDIDEKCTSLAESFIKKINVYTELDERTHGKAIIEAYPLITARLLKRCGKSSDAIVRCGKSFDDCAAKNREERPELYSAVRKIKLVCHSALGSCFQEATAGETTQLCIDARTVANGLIRGMELSQDSSFWKQTLPNYIKTIGKTTLNMVKKGYNSVKETAIELKNSAGELLEDIGSGIKNGASAAWKWISG